MDGVCFHPSLSDSLSVRRISQKVVDGFGRNFVDDWVWEKDELIRFCQAGHIWGHTLMADPTVPSPGEWGWIRDDKSGWASFWSTLQEASNRGTE